MSPFDLPAGRQVVWIGVLWLIALGLPGGFWLARARGFPNARQSVTLPIVAAIVGLLVMFVIAPKIAGTAPGAVWEWLTALGGLAAGTALAHLVPQRLTAGQ